jgi:hypothetical protein
MLFALCFFAIGRPGICMEGMSDAQNMGQRKESLESPDSININFVGNTSLTQGRTQKSN